MPFIQYSFQFIVDIVTTRYKQTTDRDVGAFHRHVVTEPPKTFHRGNRNQMTLGAADEPDF